VHARSHILDQNVRMAPRTGASAEKHTSNVGLDVEPRAYAFAINSLGQSTQGVYASSRMPLLRGVCIVWIL
jgi:hypothetical protein